MIERARRFRVVALLALVGLGVSACSDDKPGPTTPTPPPVVNPPRLTAPTADAPAANTQLDTLRPTLTVRNGTSDQTGTRTYEFQISDNPEFSTAASRAARGYRVVVTKPGVAEGGSGTTSFTVEEDLQPTTKLYWRARMTQGATTSEWSQGASFRTKLMGFSRPGELYDPLIHGETVGQLVGNARLVPGRGVELPDVNSYVRYLLPQTVPSGEYSMDVEGLRANGPGDKAKVFGMQEGTTDFITNDYRIDIQYRGTAGFPPNAIQWRVIYGDADDLDVRYEPDTQKRFDSVFLLNPSTTYHWKFTWGPVINLRMSENGINGPVLYDYGMPAPDGVYTPSPHYAYLGAPLGRSGNESASIPGTIYRNVWLSSQPRPPSLGSALQP